MCKGNFKWQTPRFLNTCCWLWALVSFSFFISRYQSIYENGVRIEINPIVPTNVPIKSTVYAQDFKAQIDTLYASVICGVLIFIVLVLWSFIGNKFGKEWHLQIIIAIVNFCCIGLLFQNDLISKYPLVFGYTGGSGYSNLSLAINGTLTDGEINLVQFFYITEFAVLFSSILFSIWGGFIDYKKKSIASIKRLASEDILIK